MDPEFEARGAQSFRRFGKEHFDHIVSEYVEYFLELRPHQGIGNVLLPKPSSSFVEAVAEGDEGSPPLLSLADIKCETRLGGVLKHFYREAA